MNTISTLWGDVEMKPKKEKRLEDDLLPKNPNLVRRAIIKVKGGKKVVKTFVPPSQPVLFRLTGEIDPFSDSLQFMKYYRYVLENKTEGQVVFETMNADAIMAAQILDLLLEHKRDKKFLDTWIQYFYDNNLKGQKALKPKYTSLKCFKDTFEVYNKTFYIPN